MGRPECSVSGRPAAGEAVVCVLTVSFCVCVSSFGEALFMNSKLISGVTEFLNTERELDEVNTQPSRMLRTHLLAKIYSVSMNHLSNTVRFSHLPHFDHRMSATCKSPNTAKVLKNKYYVLTGNWFPSSCPPALSSFSLFPISGPPPFPFINCPTVEGVHPIQRCGSGAGVTTCAGNC